jgi:hypothetical protein
LAEATATRSSSSAGGLLASSALCFVEALLVAISADLFALGDALVDVDKRLFSS